MKKIENYYNLDFLKIIFIFTVLGYHCIRKLGFWCEGSIDLFFMISGFLCAITFKKELSIVDFIKRKISSFMPFLIFSILTLLPLQPFSIQKILNNLFLTPIWYYDLYVSVGWFIIVWFWISLFLFCLQKTLKKEYVIWIVALSVFISTCLRISHNHWLVWEKIGFLNGGWFMGIMGMGSGYLLSFIPYSTYIEHGYKYLLYTIIEIFSLGYTLGSMFIKFWYVSPYFMFISSCILVFLFIQKKGALSRFTNISFFGKFRKFILPIYLLQQAPFETFYRLLYRYKPLFIAHPYLTIVTVTFSIIAYGICCYYIIKLIRFFMLLVQKRMPSYNNNLS